MNKNKKLLKSSLLIVALFTATIGSNQLVYANNPLIEQEFWADPSIRTHETDPNTLYIYMSHDNTGNRVLRPNHYNMDNYHVWSTTDLVNFTDHGQIFNEAQVPWADDSWDQMYAPDAVYKNGKYYFYFPARDYSGSKKIGVAISDSPHSGFVPQAKPMENIIGIDPAVLLDGNDAYFYWETFDEDLENNKRTNHKVQVARLRDDMLELDGPITTINIQDLPTHFNGIKEGPWAVKYDNRYYLLLMASKNRGREEMILLSASTPDASTWQYEHAVFGQNDIYTIHGSVGAFKNQWYIFYHNNTFPPFNGHTRSPTAEKFIWDTSGSYPLIPELIEKTKRGIGIPRSIDKIQMDRYTVLHNADIPAGSRPISAQYRTDSGEHKIVLGHIGADDWVLYEDVQFDGTETDIKIRYSSLKGGGKLEVRQNATHADDGVLLATVDVPNGGTRSWLSYETLTLPLDTSTLSGTYNIVVVFKETGMNLDWISFTKDGEVPVTQPLPTSQQTKAYVNAGDLTYETVDGITYSPSNNFTQVKTYSVNHSISNTEDDALYQSEHFHDNFSWNYELVNGTYDVTLHFAELYHNNSGSRMFNVTIENEVVLQDFDILDYANKFEALDQNFQVVLTDGLLNIAFTTIQDKAKVNAITVVPSGTQPPQPPITLNTNINAGGGAYIATDDKVYDESQGFYVEGSVKTYRTRHAISGTGDDTLYQSEVWAKGGNLIWEADVPEGEYLVIIKFAEIYETEASKRTFGVLVEGTTVNERLDIFAEVGANAAYDIEHSANVSDGKLTIELTRQIGNPKISAILVRAK